MQNKTAALLIFFLLFNTVVQALPCATQEVTSSNLQVLRDSFKDGTCFVSVRSVNESNLTFRDYTATDKGLLMVFNSFGNGPEAQFTGAREFYFFPRNRKVDFTIDPRSRDAIVHFANGDDFIFDSRTADVKSIGRGHVKVDHSIVAGNKGGVEILDDKGLWLDMGFAFGHSPSQEPNRLVTFHFPSGQLCLVQVREIFEISTTGTRMKLDDQQLLDFLNQRCP